MRIRRAVRREGSELGIFYCDIMCFFYCVSLYLVSTCQELWAPTYKLLVLVWETHFTVPNLVCTLKLYYCKA